jgi:hypothetical protein
MSRHQPDFKSTQVFGWDTEPVDERPTDFGHSTGFSALSGYGALQPAPTSVRRRREHRAGFAKLAGACLVALGLGIGALVLLRPYLQA